MLYDFGDSVRCVPVALEELLSLLGSGLVGVGEEELEEALGRSRGGEGSEGGSGRESRVALYEFSDPLVCEVGWQVTPCGNWYLVYLLAE